jgi:hypothetical protein
MGPSPGYIPLKMKYTNTDACSGTADRALIPRKLKAFFEDVNENEPCKNNWQRKYKTIASKQVEHPSRRAETDEILVSSTASVVPAQMPGRTEYPQRRMAAAANPAGSQSGETFP